MEDNKSILKQGKEQGTNRILWVDILKILASIAVVVLHVASKNYMVTADRFQWEVFNFFDGLSRWSVPVFSMVTGIFLLKKDKVISIKDIYAKYVKRMLLVLIFWNILYAILYALEEVLAGETFNIWDIFSSIFVSKAPHLWYLYMLIGLYIVTPLLKKIVESEKLMKYYLCLWVIFQIIIGSINMIPNISTFLESIIKDMYIYWTMGFTGYFILGYYLSQKHFQKKVLLFCIIVCILAGIITVLGTYLISVQTNTINTSLYSNFSVNIFVMSVTVFICTKSIVEKISISDKLAIRIQNLAKYSFGVYLIHPMLIAVFNRIGFSTLNFNPIIMVILISMVVYVMSLGISYIMNKIPKLNKIV